MIADEILAAIRRGINTRHRLCLAFPKHDSDEVRHAVASLIYRGAVRARGQRLEVV